MYILIKINNIINGVYLIGIFLEVIRKVRRVGLEYDGWWIEIIVVVVLIEFEFFKILNVDVSFKR